ncbi:MAG TPA: 1-(5-phosphoribosyl)-5-[(5-phosphoribosylamino)methylideneamino]imidazole-4-carboxamide isomerase [Bacillota bacterium]
MRIIPAIDLRGGACVRLEQGDYNRETVYGADPVAVAERWVAAGAKRLHVVDLDGAKAGAPLQKAIVRKIVEKAQIPVEVGGGIRTRETIRSYLEDGVQWVILGSAAVRDRELLAWACAEYPGRIILGLDARHGKVAVDGWLKDTGVLATDFAKQAKELGVEEIIYTDISRDGTLSGPNLEALEVMAKESGLSVIASGGVSSLADLLRIKTMEPLGVSGAIVGKALYSGRIDLAEAIRRLEGEDLC